MGAKGCGQPLCLLFIPPSLGEDRLRNLPFLFLFLARRTLISSSLYLKASFGYKQVGDLHVLPYPLQKKMVTDSFPLPRFSIAHGPSSKPSWPGSVPSTSSEARACSTLTVSTTADRSRYGLACSSLASLCALPVRQPVAYVGPPPFCPRLTFPRLSAACLAEICSSIPLSGSIYVWAAEAGGKKYGRFFGFVV